MDISSDTIVQNRYRLQHRLGRGSFGEVWSAHDEVADVDVALKIYVALDDKGIEEFRSEFRNVINLVHTNILRPEYYDVSDSRPFLVMPLCRGSVDGQSGGMSESELWRFIRDVSSGLAYLHSHDILHRDIKPANILINADGDYVISDFGISTRMRSTMRRSSMRQDKGMDTSGTIAYMAPELFTKSPSAVKATDIWAFGATLYELMTGELLFFGQGGVVQLNGAELPELPDSYSQDLRDTVTSCLSMDTWRRPTASELAGYAESMLKGEKVRKPWKDRDPRSLKKKWIWLMLLLLFTVGGSFTGYKLLKDNSEDFTSHYIGDNYDNPGTESGWAEMDLLSRQEESLMTESVIHATAGTLDGHNWVDLGLSVLWATCNVGALNPSDYGNYYAWGEIATKSSYTEENSKTYKKRMLDISGKFLYDAATYNWSSCWRMPTRDEFDELVEKCNWQWMSYGSHKGYMVTGLNGNSIFLPAAGLLNGSDLVDAEDFGYYYSSTPYRRMTHNLIFYKEDNIHTMDCGDRWAGLSVRPVLDKEDVLIEERRLKLDSIKKEVSRGIKDSAPTFGLG